jgi:hypothetical protein
MLKLLNQRHYATMQGYFWVGNYVLWNSKVLHCVKQYVETPRIDHCNTLGVIIVKLTMHVDHDSLADCRRDSIRCYTQVGTHLRSRNLCKF